MTARLAFGRLAFLAPAMGALAVGLTAGLARLGLPMGTPAALDGAHGPLMVGGFLGTVIGIERAVALGRPRAWAGPASSLAGAALLVAGHPAGGWLLAASAAMLVSVFVEFWLRERALHVAALGAGAACWLAAQLAWLAGVPLSVVAWGWIAFLTLTIAGERLELSRLRALPRLGQRVFVGLLAAVPFAMGAVFSRPQVGIPAIGAVLVGQAAWLLHYDLARRNARMPGLPGFIGVSLMVGYVWLGIAGLLALLFGHQVAGLRYDAQLHAFFVGFVISMILGHAPIIFPAVLRADIPFTRLAWAPLVLLHASLVVRVGGDLVGHVGARAIGGAVGAAAIALFVLITAGSVVRGVLGRRAALAR